MYIYLVITSLTYEGSEVLGVHSDREKAEKDAEEIKNSEHDYDFIDIEIWKVDEGFVDTYNIYGAEDY